MHPNAACSGASRVCSGAEGVQVLALLGPAGPVRLWRVDLGHAPDDAVVATLSAAERARAARFVFERDRRRYLAAHVALRGLLAEASGIAAFELVFNEGPFGKPRLPDPAAPSFNLSHSGDVALIGIGPPGVDIGVDIEVRRTMSDALELAERHFAPAEIEALRATPPDQRDHAFLCGWTRKEACLKAIGSGLSIAPHTFDAGIDTEARTVSIATPDGAAIVRVISLPDDTDIVTAIAVSIAR
jgi:4'-phosphopantetheinyl transferase